VSYKLIRLDYNFKLEGLGRGISVVELVREFEKVTGTKVPTLQGSRRFGDVGTLICDSQLALRELKWIPKYNLPRMCKIALSLHCHAIP